MDDFLLLSLHVIFHSCTCSQFLVIKQGAVFGKWDDDWKADFQEICGLLSTRDNIISIPVEEEQSVRLKN